MDIGGTAAGFASQGWNMKFAEEMASSQYQRAVADMKAAGLNPNAMFGGGGGAPASAPGGQSGSAMGGGGLLSTAREAVDINKQAQETERIKAGTENTKQENKLLQAQTASAQANAKAQSAAAEVSSKSDTNYAKSLDSALLKTVDTFKRYVPLDKLISGIGSAFGGRSSAKQSTAGAAASMAPQKGSSAKFTEEDMLAATQKARQKMLFGDAKGKF